MGERMLENGSQTGPSARQRRATTEATWHHTPGSAAAVWKQPRLLVIWGKYDLSFDSAEPERYHKDVPKAEVHVLDAGHFALDTAADQIAQLIRGFMK